MESKFLMHSVLVGENRKYYFDKYDSIPNFPKANIHSSVNHVYSLNDFQQSNINGVVSFGNVSFTHYTGFVFPNKQVLFNDVNFGFEHVSKLGVSRGIIDNEEIASMDVSIYSAMEVLTGFFEKGMKNISDLSDMEKKEKYLSVLQKDTTATILGFVVGRESVGLFTVISLGYKSENLFREYVLPNLTYLSLKENEGLVKLFHKL